MAINILFEVSAINPTDGTAKVFRLSSAGAKSSGVYLDNKTWTPAIKAGPVFDISVWSGGPTAANISYGSLTVAANRLLDNLDWTKFNFEGAQATIWLGQDGQAFGDYRQIWSGAVGPIERANDRDFSLALFGPDASLKRPLLSATYAGTGNAEGSAALTGTHKPFALGACVNVAPVLVDAVYWIYQYHGYGLCPLTAVYSNALTLGAPKATADTYAALKALTLVPGEWAAAPAIGMFRLGTDPGPVKITADVGTGSTVGAAIFALMQLAGISPERIAASVTGIGGSYALYSEQQATVGDLVRDAALWAGRYLIPDSTGKFHAAPHTSSKTATALTDANTMADQVKELVPAAPVWRVRVGHTRVWSPHNVGEISPAVAELAEQSSANEAAAKAAQDAADAAAAEAEYAKQRLLNQASDGILDRTEKLELSRELEAYTAERLGIIAQGNSFGLTAEVAAYTTAYNNLFNYLNGLSPSINDTTQDTAINGNFIAFRKDYFVARQNLLEKVPGVTATRAVWANVTGQGKPENNATVGAPLGTHVGGVPVVDLIGAIKDANGNVIKIVDVKAELASAKISLDADIATVRTDAAAASAEAAQVRTDLIPTIAAAEKAGTDASVEAATVRDNLSAEVSRAKGEEGTLSTRIVTAQGRADAAHTSINEETTQRVAVDTVLSNKVDVVEAKLAGTTDSELAARIRNEETARVNAVSAVASQISAIEVSATGSGNLLSNTDFATADGWTQGGNLIGASPVRVRNDNDYWIPRGESILYMDVAGANIDHNLYSEVYSSRFAVLPNSWIQFYGMTASHRSRCWISLFFYDLNGNDVGYAGENFGERINNGGPDITGWDHTGRKSHRVPTSAVSARMVWRLFGPQPGESGGVAWLWHPYVGYAKENQTGWNPYSAGSAKTQVVAANARIADEATASYNRDTAISNRVSTTEAQIAYQHPSGISNAIVTVDARVTSEETARVSADSALATRANTVEAKLAGTQDSELAARIRSEETARVSADQSLATRSNTLESQMAGGTGSALKTLIQNNRKNLADVSWWKKGASIPWGLNSGQRNEIVEFPHGGNFSNLPMPDGSSGDAWLCQAGPDEPGGGWNSGAMAPLDPDKSYRFIIPIAQLGGRGARTAYWGTGGVCPINTTYEDTNPYFAIASNMEPDRWHLFVGYIFPRNSGGKTHDGAGVYDMVTGQLVAQGWNYCFHPGGSQPIHRAYQFYAYHGSYQAFGRPLVELVDGSETPFPILSTYTRNLSARITTEETARATADSALAGRATTLETSINSGPNNLGSLSGRISDEAVARVQNDNALANRVSTTEAQFRGDQDSTIAARIRDEATASYNRDVAIGNRVSTVEANYVSADTAGGIAQARVNDEATTRATADTGLANRISVTEAQFRGDQDSTIAARIRDEATVRSNADVAISNRVSTVEANYVSAETAGNIAQAKVSDEATARANADSALAARASNVEARAGSLESRTGINETAIVDTKNKLAAARLELSAVTSGGRAAITLRSDNNGGAGVDIEGDVTFKGKLDIQENVGGNIIKISSSKGFRMIAPNGVVFIDLGL